MSERRKGPVKLVAGSGGATAPAKEPSGGARGYWLLKSEPNSFSFDDLMAAPGRTTCWDGVRNYQARNFMRDDMRMGDGVLFYASNADPSGVTGLATIARAGYPDHFALDDRSQILRCGEHS